MERNARTQSAQTNDMQMTCEWEAKMTLAHTYPPFVVLVLSNSFEILWRVIFDPFSQEVRSLISKAYPEHQRHFFSVPVDNKSEFEELVWGLTVQAASSSWMLLALCLSFNCSISGPLEEKWEKLHECVRAAAVPLKMGKLWMTGAQAGSMADATWWPQDTSIIWTWRWSDPIGTGQSGNWKNTWNKRISKVSKIKVGQSCYFLSGRTDFDRWFKCYEESK